MSWSDDRQRDYYDKMVGAKLLAVLRRGDKFAFKTTNGPFAFTVVGDCCSRSFVESIDIDPGACGSEIVSVAEADMETPPDANKSGEYDVLSCYAMRVQTKSGAVVVDFRNDSNGYYGGNVEGINATPRTLHEMETLAEAEQ